MNPLYFLVAERAYHRCEYCHAPESIFNAVLEVEHITPLVAGGTSTEENLALEGDSGAVISPSKGIEEAMIKKELV